MFWVIFFDFGNMIWIIWRDCFDMVMCWILCGGDWMVFEIVVVLGSVWFFCGFGLFWVLIFCFFGLGFVKVFGFFGRYVGGLLIVWLWLLLIEMSCELWEGKFGVFRFFELDVEFVGLCDLFLWCESEVFLVGLV